MTDVRKSRREVIFRFLKMHINAFYVAISALLVLLIISLLTVSTSYTSSTVQTVTDFSTVDSVGYGITVDKNGNTVYSPAQSKDFMLILDVSDIKDVSNITLTLNEPLSGEEPLFFYCSDTAKGLVDAHPASTYTAPDKKSVSLYSSFSGFDFVGIAVPEAFSPESIVLEGVTLTGMDYGINPIALIMLAVILLSLVIFEGKFGFFRWLKSLFTTLYCSTKALLTKKQIALFTIRTLLILSVTALGVSAVLILMLVKMSAALMIYIFIMSLLVIGLYIADRILSGKICAPKMLLVSVLVCGFALTLLLPPIPFNSWDEEYHYARCVDIKCIISGVERTCMDGWMASRNPAIFCDTYFTNPSLLLQQITHLDSFETPSLFWWVNPYKSVGYAPFSLVMAFGDVFNTSFFATVILSKLASVLTYAFIIYAGVRKLKSGVYIFSSIALLPVSVFLASSFSYDYLVTALLMYSFAYFISELQQPDKKFTLKDGIFMLGALVIACGPKAIYFVLGVPMLFMGKHKFESKKAHRYYLIACVCAMLTVLLSFILPFLFNIGGSSDNRGGEAVSSGSQIDFILGNPLKYTKILLGFLGEYTSLRTGSAYSVNFAYMGTADIFWGSLSLLLIVFCTLLDKSEHDGFKGSAIVRGVSVLTAFASVCLVATALYVSFTPVGLETVLGCQWRYIIPILIPLCAFVGSPRIRCNTDRRVMSGAVFGALCLNFFATAFDILITKII